MITAPHLLTPPAPNLRYWFVLGHAPIIAAAELDAVLNLSPKEYDYQPPILKVTARIQAKELIKNLGGTIKIARELKTNASENEMLDLIKQELGEVEGKINFGISFYGCDVTLAVVKNLGIKIKKIIKREGRSARFVANRDLALSSVTVEKNGLTKRGREFLITREKGLYSLAVTETVQPFAEFSARDYGRPGRDDYSGMLPPKLAMMIINISRCPKDKNLLDPFCGSGTIITEAMLLGYRNLIGADISKKAVADAKKNIEWTNARNTHHVTQNTEQTRKNKIEVIECDVANLNKNVAAQSIDAIVTEPYLGKPLRGNESKEALLTQARQLKKLYLNAFQQFYQILKPGGVVIFIIPSFKFKNEWVVIDSEKEINKIGLHTEKLFLNHTSLLYARPGQWVGREIWKFRKE